MNSTSKIKSGGKYPPETGKVQTVIWRCKCMFWRENGSHSGHWEAHLRNPKSKLCHHGSCWWSEIHQTVAETHVQNVPPVCADTTCLLGLGGREPLASPKLWFSHHTLHWQSSCYQIGCIGPILHVPLGLSNRHHIQYPIALNEEQISVNQLPMCDSHYPYVIFHFPESLFLSHSQSTLYTYKYRDIYIYTHSHTHFYVHLYNLCVF